MGTVGLRRALPTICQLFVPVSINGIFILRAEREVLSQVTGKPEHEHERPAGQVTLLKVNIS